MSKRSKTLITWLTFLLILLPFVLVTDLFPFLRFGMFAEAQPTGTDSLQVFMITYTNSQNQQILFDPEKYAFNQQAFQHLARNYFSRNEAKTMLEKLKKSDLTHSKNWYFYTISFSGKYPEKKDTLLIVSI